MQNDSAFFGIHLTHDQCWDEYKNMNAFDEAYDINESGISDQEILAQKDVYYAHILHEHSGNDCFMNHPYCAPDTFFNRDAAFKQMEEDINQQDVRDFHEGGYATEKESQSYFELHHIEPANEPYWSTCVSRIDTLLKVT
jgi:hypothetical protein